MSIPDDSDEPMSPDYDPAETEESPDIKPSISSVGGSHASSAGVYNVTESGHLYEHPLVPPSRRGAPSSGDGGYLSRLSDDVSFRVLEHSEPNELVFELIGVDVSLANALRRIMIAEVPTVAIEHVYIWNNSSIVHDEVMAHRIGLVPIDCDPRLFESFGDEEEGEATDKNTIVFSLQAECPASDPDAPPADGTKRVPPGVPKEESVAGEKDVDQAAGDAAASFRHRGADMPRVQAPGRPYTKHVYSGDMVWMPQGDQAERFPDGIRPVHEDILLAKLRPGQVLELEAHGRKGNGRDHAKYSPVATASYRLMPVVELVQPVYDDLVDLLQYYEPGVFDVVTEGGRRRATVANPYACTMSRNFMRSPELAEAVKITRRSDHFIFSVESVGMLNSAAIVIEALQVLRDKCHKVVRLADESLEGADLG